LGKYSIDQLESIKDLISSGQKISNNSIIDTKKDNKGNNNTMDKNGMNGHLQSAADKAQASQFEKVVERCTNAFFDLNDKPEAPGEDEIKKRVKLY